MPSLQSVKVRKNTVGTIRKITKAMELVATSKIRKAKLNHENVLQYSSRIEDVFYNLNTQIKNWDEILPLNPNNPRAFIIVNSDLGMCGAYNSNIIKLAKKTIRNDDYVILIGSRGVKVLSKFFDEDKILDKFEGIGDDPNYEIIEKTLDKITPLLFLNKIHSIHIISTKFINSITYEAQDIKIFPFSRRKTEELSKTNQVSKNAEFEPSPEVVIKKSLPLYLGAIIYSTLASSKVSEMSSRRVAMENSSENALEIIDKLEKQYNRIRQAKITQEITEIVAGSQNE